MITIALVNSKGGVGKTTLAAGFGVEATKETVGSGSDARPANVALVDLDPQKSLIKWWSDRKRNSGTDEINPTLMEGVDDACDAIERLEFAGGCEYVILDSPPAFLGTIESCIQCADFIVIPLRASMLDVAASEAAFVMAKEANIPCLLVLNDVHPNEGIVTATHEWLTEQGVALAKTMIDHKVSHTYAMIEGKTAAERINDKAPDKKAAQQLSDLWAEVRDLATQAAAARQEAAE